MVLISTGLLLSAFVSCPLLPTRAWRAPSNWCSRGSRSPNATKRAACVRYGSLCRTDGEGEAVNPAWHPDGQKIAFAWTRGFEPGNYNIFIMDVATRAVAQLTHGVGRNENPVWAPDGLHIVYSSKRGRTIQLFTMLADGSQQKQLTTLGNNEKPVWGRTSK